MDRHSQIPYTRDWIINDRPRRIFKMPDATNETSNMHWSTQGHSTAFLYYSHDRAYLNFSRDSC